MPVYLVASYDITDHDTYSRYNPGSLEAIGGILARHGGRPLAVGVSPEWMGTDQRDVTLVLEFPTREAALAWHEDPDYLPIRQIRLDSTSNVLACVLDGVPPPE